MKLLSYASLPLIQQQCYNKIIRARFAQHASHKSIPTQVVFERATFKLAQETLGPGQAASEPKQETYKLKQHLSL